MYGWCSFPFERVNLSVKPTHRSGGANDQAQVVSSAAPASDDSTAETGQAVGDDDARLANEAGNSRLQGGSRSVQLDAQTFFFLQEILPIFRLGTHHLRLSLTHRRTAITPSPLAAGC